MSERRHPGMTKRVIPRNEAGDFSTQQPHTFYSRDASGNVMVVYNDRLDRESDALHLNLGDHHIYGSSRLGTSSGRRLAFSSNLPLVESELPLSKAKNNYTFKGAKRYELSEHRGNVLQVITDRRIGVDSVIGSNELLATVDWYTPDVISAQDYYPFGSVQPGRSYNNGDYRYGFNGTEMDNEVSGVGNSNTTHFRQYDSRLGR